MPYPRICAHREKNPEDYFEKMVAKAHANGIRVNVFWSDNPERTKLYLELGADTILTNDYHRNAATILTVK